MARTQASRGHRARWWALAIGGIALLVGALVPEMVHGDGSSDDAPTTSTTIPRSTTEP